MAIDGHMLYLHWVWYHFGIWNIWSNNNSTNYNGDVIDRIHKAMNHHQKLWCMEFCRPLDGCGSNLGYFHHPEMVSSLWNGYEKIGHFRSTDAHGCKIEHRQCFRDRQIARPDASKLGIRLCPMVWKCLKDLFWNLYFWEANPHIKSYVGCVLVTISHSTALYIPQNTPHEYPFVMLDPIPRFLAHPTAQWFTGPHRHRDPNPLLRRQLVDLGMGWMGFLDPNSGVANMGGIRSKWKMVLNRIDRLSGSQFETKLL